MLSHSQPRIAVVEDDLIMGESLIQRLTLEGYRTEWWQTGREAVEFACVGFTLPMAEVFDGVEDAPAA